jgi:hypothetical protein
MSGSIMRESRDAFQVSDEVGGLKQDPWQGTASGQAANARLCCYQPFSQ